MLWQMMPHCRLGSLEHHRPFSENTAQVGERISGKRKHLNLRWAPLGGTGKEVFKLKLSLKLRVGSVSATLHWGISSPYMEVETLNVDETIQGQDR